MSRTREAFEENREPTPVVTINDIGNERWATLQAGAHYVIDLAATEPLESRKDVKKATGVNAALVAEFYLGPEYSLLFFDRGVNAQGSEASVIPRSQWTVSDRFLITDEAFLMRANMRSGLNGDLSSLAGLAEMCVGASVPFGRGYDHDGRFDVARIPDSVSSKHLALSIDFDDRLHVVDTYSTNLTKVHTRIS